MLKTLAIILLFAATSLTAQTLAVPSYAGSGGTPTSATFMNIDTVTQGNWKGQYGADGYVIPNDSAKYPGYAQISYVYANLYTWNTSTSDTRALAKGSAASRIASTWFGDGYLLDINLTDGNTHELALYGLDWDGLNRAERIDMLDAGTGVLLDSRSLSSFKGGEYIVWKVSGHVQLRFTLTGGENAVASGLFFDPVPGTAPPFTLTTSASAVTANSGASAVYSVSTTASSSVVITLAASNLPPGSSASFSPSSITGSGTASLTVQTSSLMPAGNYPITVTATGGGITNTASFDLILSAPSNPASMNVIIDTDAGADIDDVDALAIAVRSHQLGLCRILGVVTSTNLEKTPALVQGILQYAGLSNIPVGAFQGYGDQLNQTDNYAGATVTQIAPNLPLLRSQYPNAVTLMRKLLAASSDASVTMIAIGSQTNFSALLQSGPDASSSLTGTALVAAKVVRLVAMGGQYPTSGTGPEYNFYLDSTATSYVFSHWPTPIWSTGFEIGNAGTIGGDLFAHLPANSPIVIAHHNFRETQATRFWDPSAAMIGIYGVQNYFALSSSGTNAISPGGANTWSPFPQAGRYYVSFARPVSDVLNFLNGLLYQDIAGPTL